MAVIVKCDICTRDQAERVGIRIDARWNASGLAREPDLCRSCNDKLVAIVSTFLPPAEKRS